MNFGARLCQRDGSKSEGDSKNQAGHRLLICRNVTTWTRHMNVSVMAIRNACSSIFRNYERRVLRIHFTIVADAQRQELGRVLTDFGLL